MLSNDGQEALEQRDKLKVSYAKEVVGTVAVPGVLYGEADRRLKEQMEAWMISHINDTQVTYFSKSFKRYFGQPPSQYRKGPNAQSEESE